jgi:two-component system, NtrC family, nitrogen regulation response regulator GlnG
LSQYAAAHHDAPTAGAGAGAGADVAVSTWLVALERESRSLLLAGDAGVWDTLTRKFEAQLIRTALELTRGRRIEAAQKLGIGRNTITRKIQELGIDD